MTRQRFKTIAILLLINTGFLFATPFANAKTVKKHKTSKVSHAHYNPKPHSDDYMQGVASCYAQKFVGRRTTSGQVFTMDRFTGAHPTLPMGTKLKITNLKNNKVVYIAVNDRMAKKSGHVIDLTLLAARQIGICPGLGQVNLEIIDNDTFNQVLNGNTTQLLISANPLLSESNALEIANQFAASKESDGTNNNSSNKDNQ